MRQLDSVGFVRDQSEKEVSWEQWYEDFVVVVACGGGVRVRTGVARRRAAARHARGCRRQRREQP